MLGLNHVLIRLKSGTVHAFIEVVGSMILFVLYRLVVPCLLVNVVSCPVNVVLCIVNVVSSTVLFECPSWWKLYIVSKSCGVLRKGY